MKNQLTTIVSLLTLLFLLGIGESVGGQVVVVKGNIVAEVVESAHASSKMVSSAELKSGQNQDLLQKDQTTGNFESINLGAVKIKVGANVACNIKLHEAAFSDHYGNRFVIEPTSVSSGQTDSIHADGSKTLFLNGTPGLNRRIKSGSYQGSYTVDVSYN